MKEITVVDNANGREAKVDVDDNESLDGAISRGYEALGEKRRPSAHFVDGNGKSLDDRLGQPVSTLETDKDGTATIEIRGPTGGACLFSYTGDRNDAR